MGRKPSKGKLFYFSKFLAFQSKKKKKNGLLSWIFEKEKKKKLIKFRIR